MVYWIVIFSWALVLGCEPQFEVDGEINITVEIVGDSGIVEAPLLVQLEDTSLVEADAGIEPEPEVDDRTINERWFGDTDWGCCWTAFCGAICKGGPARVPVTNGDKVCCAPDVGQCTDVDGGV